MMTPTSALKTVISAAFTLSYNISSNGGKDRNKTGSYQPYEADTNLGYNSNNIGDNFSNADYAYDYDTSVGNLPIDELVVNAVGYGLVMLLGLSGNTLVIVSVARFRRMQNVTNIFLLSLATADLLLVCACIPDKVGCTFLCV